MNKIIYILKKYNVEPILFLYTFSRNMYMPTPANQLMIDKLCLFEHHQNYTFCQNIASDEFHNTTIARKIQAESVNYMMASQMILSVPSILAAIFLGPWLDAHSIAPKLVLLSTVFSGLFEACLMLLNVIFFDALARWVLVSHVLNGFTGGNMLCMTAVFTLAMKETPLAERTFRFTVIEFFMVISTPCANYLGSLLFLLGPWVVEAQTHNYVPLFLIAIVGYVICLTLIAVVLGEVKEVCSPEDSIMKRASIRTSLQPMSTEFLVCRPPNAEPTQQIQYVNNAFEADTDRDFKLNLERSTRMDSNNNSAPNPNNFLGSELREQKERSLSLHQSLPVLNKKNQSPKQMMKSLFRIRNAVAMYKGVVKRREEKAHILLWQIIAIYVIMCICANGISPIMLSYVNLAYQMKPSRYLRIESYGHLGFGLISTFLLSFFHKIELDDTIAIFIGLVSLFLFNFVRGIILQPIGLYISYGIGSIYLCALVACRGLTSKIVPEREIGTILGALSVLYASSPVFGSLIYTQTFNATSEFYLGTAFLAGASLVAIAIGVSVWLNVRYRRYRAKVAEKKPVDS